MKKWQIIAITLLAVLMLGAVAADRWLRPYDLEETRAAARAAGLRLAPAEFQRPQPAPGQNAAQDWHVLAGMLKLRPLPDLEEPAPGALPTLAQLDAYINEREDVAARIRRITAKRCAFFPHTWTAEETYPYLNAMRPAARFVAAEALRLALRGRYAEALREQARGFRIADHAAMDPMPVSLFVSATIESETLGGLERILRLAGPDARASAAVLHALEANPSRRDLSLALRGYAVFAVTEIRAIHAVDDYRAFFELDDLMHYDPPLPPAPPRVRQRNPLVVHYVARPAEAAFLRWLTPYMAAARGPAPARLATFERLDGHTPTLRPFAPGNNVAGLLAPVFRKMAERDVQTTARRAIVQAAASALLYRSRHGAYPARLEDAMPAPPPDPFTGKSVVYRRERGGFVVTSAGEKPGRRGTPIAFRTPAPPTGKEQSR